MDEINETVYTITNEEISRTAVTQCKEHKWEKLNENERICRICDSAIIIGYGEEQQN
jgi:hypothetical protein